MSASDYLALKKYRQMHNIFPTKNSGSNIQRKKINAILMSYRTDEYDDVIPAKWFKVPLRCPARTPCEIVQQINDLETFPAHEEPAPTCDAYPHYAGTGSENTCCDPPSPPPEPPRVGDEVLCCTHSIIFDERETAPAMFLTPRMTIEPAFKKRCFPKYCPLCIDPIPPPPAIPKPDTGNCAYICIPTVQNPCGANGPPAEYEPGDVAGGDAGFSANGACRVINVFSNGTHQERIVQPMDKPYKYGQYTILSPVINKAAR
jgi:hypothetical protein